MEDDNVDKQFLTQAASGSDDQRQKPECQGEVIPELTKSLLLKKIVSNWKSLTPKRHMRRTLKIYEEQQLNEIPGASKRTGTVMHAALTSEIDSEDYQRNGQPMDTGMRVRNHALIHYIAKLAGSNSDNDTFDFSFVQSLLKNGADVNAMDKFGQTVFHEVARSWHSDVAEFLLKNGANINQQDKYGRAPLHVAAAVDYVEMVEFLVSKGADVNIRTTGELQAPIHFAAKNDACKSLKALIAYGVDVNCRDYQERTPLQLAAAMSRAKAARLLIEMGVPAGVYDKDGEMALSLLVIKMPDVARLALNQFQSEDKINHKKYFFLNYLEGTRVVDGRCTARTPIEAAIVSDNVSVIIHPVMQCFILTKWQKFGKRWAWFDFIVNTLSAIIWTIMGVTLPLEEAKLYHPPGDTWWRMVLALIALLLTIHEIIRQFASTVKTKRSLSQWKNYRETSLLRDKPFCHPQWPDENRYVDSEIKAVRDYRWLASHDRWLYVDWVTLLLIIAATVSHIVFFILGTNSAHTVHVRIMCVLLIVIWVRILKFVRPFQGLGPFVASFTRILNDILLSLFLIAIIFLPYASCFWIVFGPLSPNPAQGYDGVSAIIYEVFMLTVMDYHHNVEPFIEINPFMAKILSITYVSISFVIVLNLIIAMITDTFKRVFSYAQEHAAMERAKTILNIENSLRSKTRNLYWDHIRLNCSPLTMDRTGRFSQSFYESIDIKERLNETHQIIDQRFAKTFEKGRISTIEEMLKFANEIVANYSKSKEMLCTVSRDLKSLEDIVAIKVEAAKDRMSQENDVNGSDLKECTTNTKSGREIFEEQTTHLKRKYSIRSEPDYNELDLKRQKEISKRRHSTKSEPDIKVQNSAKKNKSMSKSGSHIPGRKMFHKDTFRDVFMTETRPHQNREKAFEDDDEDESVIKRRRSKSTGHITKSSRSDRINEESLRKPKRYHEDYRRRKRRSSKKEVESDF